MSAVELALRQFAEYSHALRSAPPSSNWADLARRLDHSRDNDLSKLAALIDGFERWFYEMSAPKSVQLSRPSEWYPRARMMRRRFVFHCGPTNSGKTHAALEAMVAAKSGVYCAPLKALASQVWRKLNERVPCDLLIGDERQFAGFAEHTSCTVEMTPIEFTVDVGVIDEIQLIEDTDRGWAWTRAVLGLPAREIHLCGEARALPIIKKLLYEAHNLKDLRVLEYKRLVPLEIEPRSLDNDFKRLRSGDCVVAFSRKAVFQTAAEIRRTLPNAVVRSIYGGLPFTVRERESASFNDQVQLQDEAKPGILVTTDAIAYGLNMSIGRIIFAATRKFDGRHMIDLPTSTVMQVAGRAGRYGMQFEKGKVCGLRDREHRFLLSAIGARGEITMLQPTQPVFKAGLLPTAEILSTYASMHRRRLRGDQLRFVDIVKRFAVEATVTQHYFACDMSRALLPVANIVSDIEMSDDDRVMFCFAPVSVAGEAESSLMRQYAIMHAKGGPVELLLDRKLDELERLVASGDTTSDLLSEAESIYRMAEAYCWLSWRFRRTFKFLEQGTEVKKRAAQTISDTLPM
jgi:ATP-dependent RNA helicase SUPV3L1/SUV3